MTLEASSGEERTSHIMSHTTHTHTLLHRSFKRIIIFDELVLLFFFFQPLCTFIVTFSPKAKKAELIIEAPRQGEWVFNAKKSFKCMSRGRGDISNRMWLSFPYIQMP